MSLDIGSHSLGLRRVKVLHILKLILINNFYIAQFGSNFFFIFFRHRFQPVYCPGTIQGIKLDFFMPNLLIVSLNKATFILVVNTGYDKNLQPNISFKAIFQFFIPEIIVSGVMFLTGRFIFSKIFR